MAFSHSLQKLQHFVIEKPAVRRCAGAGGNGRAEGVDIECDVYPHAIWNMRHHAACAHLARLADADDIAAHCTRIGVAFLGSGADVADAHLGQARHIVVFGGAAHGVAVAMAHAVALIHKIQMRVDLQDVDVALTVKGADARDVD